MHFDDILDIADAANQYAPFVPPATLAGLPKSPKADRAVGVYGSGMTQLVAVPLWSRAANPLREQLLPTPGVRRLDEGVMIRVGLLGVVLTWSRRRQDEGWLVSGNVTDGAPDRGPRRRHRAEVGARRDPLAGPTKRFGRILAVDGLDLDVREGDIYGFLGANGSGKTTTVRMLLGLVLPTSGTIEVMGRPIRRSARAYCPGGGRWSRRPRRPVHLSGRANLALFDAPARRARRPARTASTTRSTRSGWGRRPPGPAYSLGMRQRLGLAHALLRRPRLLVLDEPTNGLDPQGIHEIRGLLDLHAGATVFLSSHLLAEVEQLCTRGGRPRPGLDGRPGPARRAGARPGAWWCTTPRTRAPRPPRRPDRAPGRPPAAGRGGTTRRR